MGQQKQYDYVAATLFNPDLTPNDLMTMGVDSSTAEIKERDFYKNNEEVKKLFTDDSGNFDESKFNDFYDSTVETYNEKAQQRFEDLVLNNFEYNPGDWMSGGNRYIDASPTFSASENPLGDFSIEALGKMSASNLSAREIAQTNKVFDTETGEWMDYTPNEMGFWKTLSSPTLVLAQYDEDEYDANGNLIHQKGEYKKSEDGRTYYETLGERSMSNRVALSAFDVITEDGSAANKYDFFDGDGLTKSAVGAAARNAVKLLPLLIPYGIGGAYAEVSAALNFAQVLPEIGKALCGLIPGEQAETMAFLDKMEGEFAKTKGSVSDYSQAKTVTGENFFNFVGDTAIQLFQQKAVANASKKFMETFGKTNPELATAISVGYMGVTSSQGTWDAFKEAGASDTFAGLAVLANVAALSTLLNQNYFKDWAFKGNAIFDENITSGKPAMLAMAKQARGITEGKATAELNPATAKNVFGKLVNYFRAGSVTDTGITVGMTINDFVKGSLNEGLEEVMEEGASDLIKGATQALNLLGINVTEGDKELDFGITPEDMIQRYGMALGGGIGGGLVFQTFGHLGKKNREDFAKNIKNLNDNALREVTYMIANGRGNELKRYYKRLHDNGMLGSTDLSGTQFEALSTKKEEGTTNAAITAKKGESQNDLVYDMLINQVDQLEQAFKDEGINIPESVLTKNFRAQELKQLLDSANGSTLLDESPDKAKLASLLTTCGVAGGFLNDFNYYSAKLVKAKETYEAAIEAVKKDKPAETAEQKEALEKTIKNNADVKKAKKAYEDLQKEIEAIRNGERNAKYIKYGAFALNKDVSKAFTGLQTFDEYVLAQTGKTAKQLKKNKERYAELEFEYEQYSANNQNKAYRGYTLYEEAQKRWGNHLDIFSKQTKESKLNDSEFSASNLTMYLGYRQTLDDIDKKRSQDISDEERAKLDAQYNEAFKAYNNVRASVVGLDPLSLYVDQDTALKLFNQKAKLEAEMHGLQEKLKNAEGEDKEETQRRISVRAEELLVVTSQLDALDKLPADLTHALDHAVKDSTTVDKQLKANEDIKLIGDQLLTKYQKDADEKVIKTNDEQLVTFLSHITSNVIKQGMTDGALMRVINEGSNAQRLAFGRGIITLQNYIKNGEFSKALEYLKTLKTLGDEIAEEEPDEFDFDYYVGSVGDESLEDYLTKMNALRDKCTYTPTLDLLKQAYVEINGEPTSIFDLIDKQKKGLLSVESLDQFLMTEDSIKGIDKALKVLDLVEGFVGGSVSGLNEILNSQGGNFATLNDNAAKAIASDLQYLKSNLQILKDLAINNSGQKLNEHRKIAVHCKPLFIKSLLEDAAKIESKMQLTTPIKDLWTKACLTTKWNESAIPTLDTYAQYEQTCIEFESLFYKSLPVDKNNLGSKIASIYEDEGMLWAGETSQLTSDLTAISAFDQAQYILSLCAIDSKVFTTALRAVNEENKKKSPDEYFSPVYGQETLIREALCSIANPTLYSEFITKINDKSNASKFKGKGYEEGKNDALKKSISQSTQLERVFAILGGAGTGKTSAVLNTINLILSKVNNTTGVEMLIMAPTDVQLKNINIDSIKCSKPITKLTVEDALKKSFKYPPTNTMTTVTIGGETRANFNATYADSCGTRAWNGKTKGDINTLERNADGKHFTDTEAIRVIVVDECSQISGAQWEALNQIARDENAVIITTGDYHQQAAKVSTYYTIASDGTYPTMQKEIYTCTNGLENFSVNKSPFIEMTMRSDNMGMYYASVQFSKLFAYCQEKASEENDVPIFGFSSSESQRVQSYFKEVGAIKVPYARSDNWESFGGITYATKTEADKAIATLGQKNEIYYINDGTAANYSGKVSCIGLDKVQGGQKDYVVIDLDWFTNGNVNKRFFINELDLARTLYTLTQRAKKGVIIVDNGNNEKLKDFISTYEDNSSLLGFSMNKDARESYYNWWHKGKEKSTSTEEIGSYFIPAKASGKPTSTKRGKSTSSTGTTGTTSGKPGAQHLGKPVAGKDPHGADGEIEGKPGSNYWEDTDKDGTSYIDIAKDNKRKLQETLKKNTQNIDVESKKEANNPGSETTGYQQVIQDFYFTNDFDAESNPKEHTLAQKIGIEDWGDNEKNFYQQLSAYIADTVLASDKEIRSIDKDNCVKPVTYTLAKTEGEDGKWYAKIEDAGRGYSEGDINVMRRACDSFFGSESYIDNITEYLKNAPTLYCVPITSVNSKKLVVARFANDTGDFIDIPLFKCSSQKTGILMQPPVKKRATGGLVKRPGLDGTQTLSSFIDSTKSYCQPLGDIQIYQGPDDDSYGSFSKNAVNQGASFMLFTDRPSVIWQVKYGNANPWQRSSTANGNNEFVHNFPESTFLVSTALSTNVSTALKYTCALCELKKACATKNRDLAESWAAKVDELGREIFGQYFNSSLSLVANIDDDDNLPELLSYSNADGLNSAKYNIFAQVSPDPNTSKTNVYAQADRLAGQLLSMTLQQRSWDGLWGAFTDMFTMATDDKPANTLRLYYDDKVIKLTPADASTNPKWNAYIEGDAEDVLLQKDIEGPGITNRGKWFVDTMFLLLQNDKIGGTSIDYAKLKALSCWQTTVEKDTSGSIIRGSGSRMNGEDLIFSIVGRIETNKQKIGHSHDNIEAVEDAAFTVIEDNLAKHPAYKYGLYVNHFGSADGVNEHVKNPIRTPDYTKFVTDAAIVSHTSWTLPKDSIFMQIGSIPTESKTYKNARSKIVDEVEKYTKQIYTLVGKDAAKMAKEHIVDNPIITQLLEKAQDQTIDVAEIGEATIKAVKEYLENSLSNKKWKYTLEGGTIKKTIDVAGIIVEQIKDLDNGDFITVQSNNNGMNHYAYVQYTNGDGDEKLYWVTYTGTDINQRAKEIPQEARELMTLRGKLLNTAPKEIKDFIEAFDYYVKQDAFTNFANYVADGNPMNPELRNDVLTYLKDRAKYGIDC